MTRIACRFGLALGIAAAVFGLWRAPVAAQSNGQPLKLTAFAISMSNVATGSTATIDISVDRWSTDKEREALITTFLKDGQDALLKALQKVPVKGRIRTRGRPGPDPTQTNLGWDLRFAMRSRGADGGERILLATDRVMTFAEITNRPRSVDYPFTFLEIHLNKDGEGEGKMAVATQMTFDKKKNAIVYEHYATEPVQLTQVRVQK